VKPYGEKLKQEIDDSKSVKIGNLVFYDVTNLDLNKTVQIYSDAEMFVATLGKQWRLPNTSELNLIKENVRLFDVEKYYQIIGSTRFYDNLNRVYAREYLYIDYGIKIDTWSEGSSYDYRKIIAVRNLTSNEIQEAEVIAQLNREKEKAEKEKLESEKSAKQAEIASKMKTQGKNDSKTNYKGKKSGATCTAVTTLIFSPAVGIIPAIVCASKEPKDKNLNYPSDELMKNKDYKEEYIKNAHKTKKKKVWISYATSSAAWIIIILLL
jgi:hypothetical protein